MYKLSVQVMLSTVLHMCWVSLLSTVLQNYAGKSTEMDLERSSGSVGRATAAQKQRDEMAQPMLKCYINIMLVSMGYGTFGKRLLGLLLYMG